jgi:outer membrane receptor protein involved in Fe transport
MANLIRPSLRAATVVAIAAVLLTPAGTSAQTLYGSIVGHLADESGGRVPGATVTATNSATGFKVDAVSDANGAYAFRNLLPGVYDIAVTLEGFRELRHTGMQVSAGNPVRLDLKLQVGALTEALTVVGDSTLLQTEKADLSTLITSKEVVNLPLNQFRNYQSLLNLVPGATPAQFQNAEIDTPGRALRTNLNGTQPNSNAFRIDGAVSVNIWLPHHVGYVNSAETIETVNISTNNFDADQGMAAGAAVTVVTKSGTNEFHGSGFILHNSEGLNANAFANNANGLKRPPLSNDIFGGTIGGPIVKNKLFFFGAWERYQARRGTQVTYSVPSLRMRNGDFSEVAPQSPGFRLYNPFTGTAGGVGREQFPNDTIPSDLISPVWRDILNFYPEPNSTQDLNRNLLPDDFVQEREVRNDRDNFDLKLTYQRNASHSIWGRFGMLDAEVIDNFSLGFDQGSLGDTRVYVATVGHTWTLSPNLVLDGNFGMNRQDQEVTGPDFGEDLGQDLGIPGTNGPDIRQSGLPHFDIPNGTLATGGTTPTLYDIGTTPNWMPLFRKERSYTFSSALTWLKGRHQVRTGLDIVNHRLNHIQAEFGSFGGVRGGFQFSGLTTGTPGYIPQIWNELGAFVLGLPSIRQKDVQPEEMTAREWQYGLFVTDRWQATSKLTLNVGLRFEMYPLMKRADRGIERLDYNTYEVLLGGLGSTPEDVGIDVKKFYVAPRLGAVYRFNEDTVLRAGYGRTFNPLPWGRPMRGSYPFDIFFNQTAEQYGAFPIQDGIPPVPIPDLSSGRVKLPPSTFIRSPNPNDVDRATIQQMNVAVERRLPWDIAVEVAYVHTRTDGGYADLDVNHSEPGAGQTGRKFFSVAGSTPINDWASRTKSRYHGLQVAVNRPFRNGLLLKGAYTLSRSENETNNDEDGWAGLTWNHPSLVSRNFALAGFDRTHVFQMGFLYELPFAKQSTSLLGRIVQNWQVNGIFSAYSGTPFTINGTNPATNCPGCGAITINVQGDPKPTGTPGSPTEPWYDKSVFSQPTGGGFEGFGNSERNQFRSPGVWNVDLGIFRSFPIGRIRPEIRIEAINVFNHTNWARPNLTFTSPQFLTFAPTAAHQANPTWGTGTRERTVQIGLRLEF